MSCRYTPVLMHVSVFYIVSIYRHVLYIVSISRHVYVYVCVCNIHIYMHTFLLIMLCKFVNKMYIKSHDMQKNMMS